MMFRYTTRHTLILVVGVVLVIVAATWGFYQQRLAEQTQSLQPLTFQFDWIAGSYYAPFFLADDAGFYETEGLKVAFVQGKGAETSAKLISEGVQVLGTSNAAATAVAVAQGLGVISVGAIDKEAVTSIFSPADRNITKPADLQGRKLGVRYYDISHSEYLAMMRVQGLDPSKVKEVGVGFDLQPLISGDVDAMYNYSYNMPVRLRGMGYEINEIKTKDWGVRGYGANIIANKQFAAESSDVLSRFLLASRRGWQLAAQSPERAVDALVARYPELDRSAALDSLKAELELVREENGEVTFCQNGERWKDAITDYRNVGLINKDVSEAAVYSNEYLSCSSRE